MRKVSIFLLVCFIAAIGNAFAYQQLMDEGTNDGSNTIIVGTESYVVNDYSNNLYDGTWDETYMGYLSLNVPASYSGYYLGTIVGNDRPTDVANLITYYSEGIISVEEWLKVDSDTGGEEGKLSYTVDSSRQSGTWLVEPATYSLNFYTIKAGPSGYALYFLPVPANSGSWTTQHLISGGSELPTVSHFSGSIVSTPVPEPATVVILGVCFATLAGFRLRKKK